MTSAKWVAAIAVAGLAAQSGIAAVRPSASTVVAAPTTNLVAGTRVNGAAKGKRSDMTQTGTIALVAGAGAAGVGIAAAAGAFDSNHKSSSPD